MEPFSFEQEPILGVWWTRGQCGYRAGDREDPGKGETTLIEVQYVPGSSRR